MKARILLSTIISVLVLGSSITAYAQPKTMADGNIFDAEFYAETYADVKEAIGDDEEALYEHYLEHGKEEGRLPYDEAAVSKSNTTKSKTKATTKSQKSSTTVVVPTHDETEGLLVWVPTKGGTKYHDTSTCSKMKDPKHVSIETAQENGYTACKKCYK